MVEFGGALMAAGQSAVFDPFPGRTFEWLGQQKIRELRESIETGQSLNFLADSLSRAILRRAPSIGVRRLNDVGAR